MDKPNLQVKDIKKIFKKFGHEIDKKLLTSIKEYNNRIPKYTILVPKKYFYYSNELYIKDVYYIDTMGTVINIYLEDPDSIAPAPVKFKDIYRKYNGEPLNNESLIIWRYGGFGDIIMFEPIIRYVKTRYKNCYVMFRAARSMLSAFELFYDEYKPDDIKAIPFLYEDLQKATYHLCLEGAIERFKEQRKDFRQDRLLKIAGITDMNDDEKQPKLRVPEYAIERIKNEIKEDREFVVFSPFSTAPSRSFTPRGIYIFLRELMDTGLVVYIIGVPKEAKILDSVLNGTDLNKYIGTKIINFIGKTRDMIDVAAIINLSVGYIGVDTGTSHIAGGINKKGIVVCSQTCGHTVFGRYKSLTVVNAYETFNECGRCPCFLHQFNIHECPIVHKYGYFKCCEDIDYQKAVFKFLDKLNSDENNN